MSKLVVVLPDQQVPFHDEKLHEVVLRWLSDVRPQRTILSGDFADFIGFTTKYPWKPDMVRDPVTAVQRHMDIAHNVLTEYVKASGSDELDFVPGNHEQRLVDFLLKRAPELYGLRPGGCEDCDPSNSLENYLQLKKLGFRLATGSEYNRGWPQAKVILNSNLAVMHGWIARKNSGASGLASLDHLGHSVIVGHTHRQAQVYRTRHSLSGPATVLVGVESGTLARLDGGLGYAMNPDWQQGFVTVTLIDDDLFDIDLAKYVNNTLIWRGQTWKRTGKGIVYNG